MQRRKLAPEQLASIAHAPRLAPTSDAGYSTHPMWTWWFIARDDEAPQMPNEEEGDRPALCFEADESDLPALGAVIGASYEPRILLDVDGSSWIVRLPDPFVGKLAEITDPSSVARTWRETCAGLQAREISSVAATLLEMRDFACEAVKGPGIVAYRNP